MSSVWARFEAEAVAAGRLSDMGADAEGDVIDRAVAAGRAALARIREAVDSGVQGARDRAAALARAADRMREVDRAARTRREREAAGRIREIGAAAWRLVAGPIVIIALALALAQTRS